jgi:murein DD-endopeptidase MepM/ murein hydrolase activator NlpD
MDPFPRGTRVSQEFRANPGGYNPPGGHTGRDYAVPVGTAVRAAADGIVRNSSWLGTNYRLNPWWLTDFGGDTLVLDCTDAFGNTDTMPTFVYAHLANSIAEVGQKVKKGQVIAISGNTGTATSGPHCHVERLNPGYDLNDSVYGRSPLDFDEFYGEVIVAPQADEVVPAPIPAPSSAKKVTKMLYITKAKGESVIWIGDMISRRPVSDPAELKVLRDYAKAGVFNIFKNGDTQDWPPAYIGVPVVEPTAK